MPPPGETEAIRPDLAQFSTLIARDQQGPARVRIRKHLLEHPDDGQAHFLFGLTYHREKRYAQAIPHFERAIELAPRFDAAPYFRGWAAFYLGDLPGARAAFERHLALRPDSADGFFGLGLVDLEEDRLDAALDRFRHAIDLNLARPGMERDIAKARVRIADVHQLRGDFAAARQELELAVALWPDHDEAYFKLFRVCTRLGDEEAAEAARQKFEAARARKSPGTRFPE